MKKEIKKSIVKAKWVVKLPEGAKIMVSEGKKVERNDLLAVAENGTIESFECGIVLAKLPKEQINKIEEEWKNKEVKKGDLLITSGGMFPKKVFSPFDGVFVGIDEFHNLKFETSKGDKKEIRSPINAVVSKIEKDEISLEFRAKGIEGKGYNSGKAWGKLSNKRIEKMADLTTDLMGTIIWAENVTPAFLTKAEVVGVLGVVTPENNDIPEDMELEMPMLLIAKELFESYKLPEDELDALLNSKSGRLLLVIE
ncbi:MAG TPA: hypothetical protein VF828_04220 [Patescibacteria group bacterium]